MFLSNYLTGTIIFVIAGALFLTTYIINSKINPPEDVELPEDCENCKLEGCFVKTNRMSEIKKEICKKDSE